MSSIADHAVTAATASTQIAALFARYARAATGTVGTCKSQGDDYGATLATSRAEVYSSAAHLAASLDLHHAAQEMMGRAQAMPVRTPPLIDFDAVGVQYVIARAWQFCAWQIDPSLPEAVPPWH